MKSKAQTGAMWPQAQGHPEPPEAERGWKDPPPEPLEGEQSCPHLDFRPLASTL